MEGNRIERKRVWGGTDINTILIYEILKIINDLNIPLKIFKVIEF